MAISVTCPSCRASFRVDDKYAGRQGPCPKCKAPITIPKVEKVTIHEEQGAATSTTAAAAQATGKTGKQALKPIARTEVQFRWGAATLIVLGCLAIVAGAYWLSTALHASPLMRLFGLLVTAIPTTIGAYAILRNDELEAYRGSALWGRVVACTLIYTALWVGFYFVPIDMRQSAMGLIVMCAAAVCIGGSLSMVLFDLDFGSGAFHCALYLAATMLLGYVAQFGWPWTGAKF